MTTALDPVISEFPSQEEADSYDLWFRSKVQEALDSTKPLIPHDQVMAAALRLIESKRKKHVVG